MPDRDKPCQEQPYPDWTTIKGRIIPGMLGPRIEPEATDWAEIADDDQPSEDHEPLARRVAPRGLQASCPRLVRSPAAPIADGLMALGYRWRS